MKIALGIVVLAIVAYTLANMLFSLSGFLGLIIIFILTFTVLLGGKRQ